MTSVLAPAQTIQNHKAYLQKAFAHAREATQQVFSWVTPQGYYEKGIPLRHPVVFYDGHMHAFLWNTLFVNVLGETPFNPEFDILFARGIDPNNQDTADTLSALNWPTFDEVQAYKAEIEQRFDTWLSEQTDDTWQNPPHPLLKNAEVLYLLLEHELMHHETLTYLIHQLPHHLKHPAQNLTRPSGKRSAQTTWVEVPSSTVRLGATPQEYDYAWDNEYPSHSVNVPAFEIQSHNITNADWLTFMDATSANAPIFWKKDDKTWQYRDLFETIPLDNVFDWPVLVTHQQATSYAQWQNATLPSEAQWHAAYCAAYGKGHLYPHGNTPLLPVITDYLKCPSFSPSFSPLFSPVGTDTLLPAQNGVYDLCRNGWEWTSTPFMPFDGFAASPGYPQYSTDFFGGKHYVVKGGSPVTHPRLLRRSLRNWYFEHYPYAYTTFRTVRPSS